VYCIGLADWFQRTLVVGSTSPASKIDWSRARHQLKKLAGPQTAGRTCATQRSTCRRSNDETSWSTSACAISSSTTSGLAGGGGVMRKVRVTLVDLGWEGRCGSQTARQSDHGSSERGRQLYALKRKRRDGVQTVSEDDTADLMARKSPYR